MLVGHAVFIGHVAAGHVVYTKETDRLAVDADLVLPLHDGGEFSLSFRLQIVNGHSVIQLVYQNTIFVQADRDIAVGGIKGNCKTEVIGFVCFFYRYKVCKGSSNILARRSESDGIRCQIAAFVCKAQGTEAACGSVIPVNEFIGTAFYKHDRTKHGCKGLGYHFCAAILVKLRIIKGEAGNGRIVSQIRHTEALHNREVTGGAVEKNIGQETAVETVLTDGLDQRNKTGPALIVEAKALLTGRMGEHSLIERKLLDRQNGLAAGYLDGRHIVDGEEFKFGAQTVDNDLVVIEERYRTGTDLGDFERMLAVGGVGMGQGMAKLEVGNPGEIQLNATAAPGQRHKSVAVVGEVTGAEHMESIFLLRSDPRLKYIAFVGDYLDGNDPGVFVCTGVETQHIFALVKGEGRLKGLVDRESIGVPEKSITKSIIGNTGDRGGDIYLFAVRIIGVRQESIFLGGTGEIHPDFPVEIAVGKGLCKLGGGF